MEYLTFGSTGWDVSTVSIGTQALGGSWGDVDDCHVREQMHHRW